MERVTELVEQAKADIRKAAYHSAEAALRKALRMDPQDAEVHAALGVLMGYTGREREALNHFGPSLGSADAQVLAQMLTDHAHCRSVLAARNGYKDKLADRLAKLVPLLPSPNVGISISACLIVRDEEKNLARCLSSIAGRVDEIVVVDTGSTDGTVNIAESFGAKVHRIDWKDDFASARNASIELATGHWILWIDADEEVADCSWADIARAVVRPQFGGYYLTVVNYMGDSRNTDQFVHSPVRLFRRLPGIKFSGRVHEQVIPSIQKLGLPLAHLGEARINHYGYLHHQMAAKNKLDRTIRLIEREVRDYPEDSFNWFNLTNAYMAAERHSDALRAGRVCIRMLDPADSFGSLAYHLTMGAMIALRRPDEALKLAEEARIRGHADILVEFQRAAALLSVGELDEALRAADRTLIMPWPPLASGDYGIVTHKTHALRGKILLSMGRLDEALQMFDHALKVDAQFVPALIGKGEVLERKGLVDEALELYGRREECLQLLKAKARLCLKIGRLGQAAESFSRVWRQNPQDHDAWVAWVHASERAGDVQAVVEAYNAYAKQREFDSDMLVGWGRALEAAGEYEKALHCYSEAIKRDPSQANAYFNGGDLLYRVGQYADAAHIYEKGLRALPNYAQGWFVLGNALAKLGLLDGAATSYKQALVLDPGHRDASQNLAIVSEAMDYAA